jgi:hypothetical protein
LTLVCCVLFGALTFGASLVRLVDRPAAYGVNFDAAYGEGAIDTSSALRHDLETSADVAAFTLYGTTTASTGTTTVDIVGMEPVRGELQPEVLAGRLPAADDELALGPLSARELHVGPGDRLTVKGASGELAMQVTGLVLVPPVAGADKLGKGALVARGAFLRIDPSAGMNTAAITYRPGSGPARRLAKLTGVQAGGVDPPPTIVNLRRVRSIPFLVSAAVGSLAMLSLGHLMIVGVRRRRRDLAILRSFGASPRWLSGVVHWQATLVTGLVLVVAVPIGGVLGRSLFRAFVDHVGVRPDVVVPFGWLAATIIGLLGAANLVAAVPARRGSRISPAATFSEG